ncbi:MAG: hypothetical protein WDW38_005433 [Sanguina aurantia]
MTKHNGKARNSGSRVGNILTSKNRKAGGGDKAKWETMWKHTTEIMGNTQSVLDRNDLEELMAMADLADRDFAAERGQAVVISMGTVSALDEVAALDRRREAQAVNAHRLRLPRRPSWTVGTTPDQLDLQERSSFLVWRRELANVEEEEKLLLTPFEKNLEVWRQLWRVLERSDIIVQVVDARDPLLYRSDDLEAYAREVHESKQSFILLNKADLLPDDVRAQWADYFDKAGVPYAFWSAHSMIEEQSRLRSEAAALGLEPAVLKRVEAAKASASGVVVDQRIAILDSDQLLELLEFKAHLAVQSAPADDPRHAETDRRVMVGLVGYPNVGKSSTINALFGSKKTAVAPTPGKTKHFQTLNMSSTLCFCDCPGLVMPKYANAKAEMVAAGVIPIDKLVDVRGPIEVVAARVGRQQLESVYGFKLPKPQPHEDPSTPPAASHCLRALAMLRGWVVGMGLPDESRAGRQIMKDYTSGKLLHCLLPPGSDELGWAPDSDPAEYLAAAVAARNPTAATPWSAMPAPGGGSSAHGSTHARSSIPESDEDEEGSDDSEGGSSSGPSPTTQQKQQEPTSPQSQPIPVTTSKLVGWSEADVDLLDSLAIADKKKPKRAEHKFQMKATREKGNRGQAKGDGVADGAAMMTGKKGGLVRVAGY